MSFLRNPNKKGKEQHMLNVMNGRFSSAQAQTRALLRATWTA
jgi:hypothetical protein